MSDTLMQQGVDLMLYGMGSVVVFLTLLVIAMVLMSGGINRWFPEPEVPLEPRNRKPSSANRPAAGKVDDKTLAAIKAAIEQHRARRR